MAANYEILPLTTAQRAWVNQTITREWASTDVMSRWRWHDTTQLPGFIAVRNDEPAGLATYLIEGDACELVTLNSFAERSGIGDALLNAVRAEAVRAGCKKLWLTTANDNLNALRFYQKRGMRIVTVHIGAVDEARRLKPGISLIGHDGIPLHDELELAINL
jgi:ribosomal protein S18 acetylase RimI-like enzyme